MCEEKTNQNPPPESLPVWRESLMPLYKDLESVEMCLAEFRRNLDRLWDRLTKEKEASKCQTE